MRVLSCKPKCLSVCFSDSPKSLESPPALKFEDAHQNDSNQSPVSDALEEQPVEEDIDEGERVESSDVKFEILPKSSLKKSSASGSEERPKERVKWMDFVGKELVEIKEFEPVDSSESEDEGRGNQACVCVIQ
ncbi:uncharacterized protein A4U43_C08F19100 [Asparagus officinalis]|uniref:uncharacterized protein LOC109820492 n=1 Tax=Asparagus officinalis TaxID=4686 RepID=UPI00098E45E5|nr:uncharacterized protein LOC109820492 [Asparagus officinalis]ONK60495.1 uncharacterized protein A4U43_C08F19100 [Asparagus officinalis]